MRECTIVVKRVCDLIVLSAYLVVGIRSIDIVEILRNGVKSMNVDLESTFFLDFNHLVE